MNGSTQPAWEEAQKLHTTAAATSSEGLSFLDSLGPVERRALADRVYEERHPAGSVILREGGLGGALYIVWTGRVAVFKEGVSGQPMLLAYRGSGEIVGEMGAVSQRPRSASVVAMQDTVLLRIDEADFQALSAEHPGISRAILRVLTDRLHASDAERSLALQEERHLARRLEKLTTEKERLAELARLRQETIALIVHDLRNPLAVIDGCLQMLRFSAPDDPDSAAQILDLAQRSTGRLLAMVEALLEVAHREEPGSTLDRRPVDLAALLQAVVENMQPLAGQSEVELALDPLSTLPLLLGDPAWLERVVTNLLDNAIAYTPAEGRVVVAATIGEGAVEVSVTDTGPGVPPEHRERIFERFSRVPGVEGRRRGFGLGLYLCRQVVEAHGGQIWVEPGPGDAGSRFAFTLPCE